MEFDKKSLGELKLKGDNGLRALAKKKGIQMKKGATKGDVITALLRSLPGGKYKANLNPTRPAPPPPPGMTQMVADQEIKYMFAEGSAEEGLLLTRVERDLAKKELRMILDTEKAFEIAETMEQLNIRNIEEGIEQDLNLNTSGEMNSAMEKARGAVAKARGLRRIADAKRVRIQDDMDATQQMGKYKVARWSDGSRREASYGLVAEQDSVLYRDGERINAKYDTFADYYRSRDDDGKMRKLERIESNLKQRGSYGAERLTYQESRLINKKDIYGDDGGREVPIFEMNFFGTDVIFAIGEPDEQSAPDGENQYHDITYFKIYIVDPEERKLKGQIGLFEVYTDEFDDPRNEYYDEDGDIDVTKMDPLLFRFVDKQYLENKEYLNFSDKKTVGDQERVYLHSNPSIGYTDYLEGEYDEDETHLDDDMEGYYGTTSGVPMFDKDVMKYLHTNIKISEEDERPSATEPDFIGELVAEVLEKDRKKERLLLGAGSSEEGIFTWGVNFDDPD